MAVLVILYVPDRLNKESDVVSSIRQPISATQNDDGGSRYQEEDTRPVDDSTAGEISPLLQGPFKPDSSEKPALNADSIGCGNNNTEEDGSQTSKRENLEEHATMKHLHGSAADLSVKFDLATTDIQIEEFTLAQAVHIKLEELGIRNDIWNQTNQYDDEYDYWQVSFVLEKEQCDDVLRDLTKLGIGRIQGTSISIFPSNYHEAQTCASTKTMTDLTSVAEKKSKFLKSVNSRLMVAQVVQSVHSSSVLTFDFLMFVVLASVIAAVGLAENSSVILVASMLVSPIMGPILAGTFGLVISHKNLCRLGVKNEVISLCICIFSGFLIGLVIAVVNSNGASWGSTHEWPTAEMKNRGLLRGLWVGILIAVPSGAGVALSILGGNTGSLVGVAISASLLPPAVNAGMLWACSLVSAFSPPPVSVLPDNITSLTHGTASSENVSLPNHNVAMEYFPANCPDLQNNNYKFIYSCSLARETVILGTVSLFLTIINILCIFIMSVTVLTIKKVVPEKMVPEYARSFWKNDIQVAKHTYQTLKPSSEATACASQIARDLAKQFREQIFPDKPISGLKSSWHNLMKVIEEGDNDEYILSLNLTGSNRPQLLKQFSVEGCHLLEETAESEKRKYNTVCGGMDLPLGLLASTTDPSTPHSLMESAKGLRTGVLLSPEGSKQFFYDPLSVNKRQKRLTWYELHRLKHRQVSLPDDIKFPEINMPRTASSLSGKKFQITPVMEEAKDK